MNGLTCYRSNDTVYTKATFSLGTVCNTRAVDTSPEDPDDDVIRFSFVIRLEDHESLENGTQKWVSAGVMYSESQMWVGQVALYALKDEVVEVNVD